MGKKILVVIDMQKDFIDGALGSAEAVKIVDNCAKKINNAKAEGKVIIYTRDTHFDDYMTTEEGKNLPVPHCIKGSDGWQIASVLTEDAPDSVIFDKVTFGSRELGQFIADNYSDAENIELIGLCTDICVISNALLIKAFCPNTPVSVDAACCAGVTPAGHDTALKAMGACQIHVTGEGEEPWR
ncbi:MAG: cysteine hydrolase [Lachnospiraceae bacterium]|nr:cysteine hydrolase [Lachnospiraceae bacterium]